MIKNNNKDKQAKFFCESCGAEVKQNARVCTYCGKFFSSVRCPKCGKTGSNDDFKKGCPACGYAVIPGQVFYPNKLNNTNNKNKRNLFYKKNNNKTNTDNNDSLPFWVYIVCICALIFVVFGVYSCL